jgi:hypothetical protein
MRLVAIGVTVTQKSFIRLKTHVSTSWRCVKRYASFKELDTERRATMPVVPLNNNMSVWDSVCETNPEYVKKVNQRGGFSAIDAYSQIRAATERFGPVGQGWGWHVVNITPLEGTIVVSIDLWYESRDNYFTVLGQKKLNTGKGPDEDAVKKALTDAITKGLSYLGFNADVFLGYFDDNKYVSRLSKKYADQGNIMAAKNAFKEACDEVEACDDEDTLDGYLASAEKLIARMYEVIPEYMNGGGDVPSWDQRVNRKRESFNG